MAKENNPAIFISASKKINVEELREKILEVVKLDQAKSKIKPKFDN
jgi:50S ribosomal subunit-associated GTPase HflX